MVLFVYCEEKLGKTNDVFKWILNNTITNKVETNDIERKQQFLDYAKTKYKQEVLLSWFYEQNKHYKDLNPPVKLELVYSTFSDWEDGEYYAHEYDKYVKGKSRKITLSNGFEFYEIICLDKKMVVADGYWEEESGNGFGDTFEKF